MDRIRPAVPPSTLKKRRRRRDSDDDADDNALNCVALDVSFSLPTPAKKGKRSTMKKRKSCHHRNEFAAGDDQNVRVVSRLRPLSTREVTENSSESIVAVSRDSSLVVNAGTGQNQKNFEFDAVFGPKSTQKEVYDETLGDLVERVLFKGFNVTVMAYGQTGSGKTFTMGTEGTPDVKQVEHIQSKEIMPPPPPRIGKPSEQDGVIPRAVYDLFQTRQNLKDGDKRVKVEMSYLEIYNEEVRDLLSHGRDSVDLHIRDAGDGVMVQNLSSIEVTSPTEVISYMAEASRKRATASTAMNAVSSRSHAICTLSVKISPEEKEDGAVSDTSREEISSKLTLVDLAGSERIKKTGAEGTRMKEGININKGLFVLGQVVSTLSEIGQQGGISSASHIPYRDSKLTRLLQDSLGGNSRTVMVACASPADTNIEESLNTLRYAQRTRNIKNVAVRNVVATGMSATDAAALRRENQLLKLQLMQAQVRLNSASPTPTIIRRTDESTRTCRDSNSLGVEDHITKGLNIEEIELVSRLRASNTALKAKVVQIEDQLRSASEDTLSASLRADQWQLRYEKLLQLSKHKGIRLSETGLVTENGSNILEQQRHEILELKTLVKEAEASAAVAKATAVAIVAGKGDLTAAEEMALITSETNDGTDSDSSLTNDGSTDTMSTQHCEKLTSELVEVSNDIEHKEAMASQMNKERECLESMRCHFEGALVSLQEEVEALNTEKISLLAKVQNQENAHAKNRRRSKVSKNNIQESIETKKAKARIADLVNKIKELNRKVDENTRSLRLRELAEKKCAHLSSEITQDKKRRAALQRRLKEESVDRRNEKKAAKKHAMQLLRDRQKLTYELNKVKEAASKQAAVLKRKAAEAMQKQKKMAEQQRKRYQAQSMRSRSSSDIPSRRKDELYRWIEREIESVSFIRECQEQIEDQTDLWNEAIQKKEELIRQGESNNTSTMRVTQNEIETRSDAINQHQKNMEDLYKNITGVCTQPTSSTSNTGIFIDSVTFQGISRIELRFILANIFERLLTFKKRADSFHSMQSKKVHIAVNNALTKERRRFEEVILKTKMQHSEQVMTLIESASTTVESKMTGNLLDLEGKVVNPNFKLKVEELLQPYINGCNKVGHEIKESLREVKDSHNGMKRMVDQVTDGVLMAAKKKKTKKKPATPISDEDIFDEESEILSEEDSADSDWNPDAFNSKSAKHNSQKKADDETPSDTKTKLKLKGNTPAINIRDDSIEENGSEKKSHTKENQLTKSPDGNYLTGEYVISRRDASLDGMRVIELKAILRDRGMPVSGRKHELLHRLRKKSLSPSHNDKENMSRATPSKSMREPLAPKDMNYNASSVDLSFQSQEDVMHAQKMRRILRDKNNPDGIKKRRDQFKMVSKSLEEMEKMMK